MRDKPALSVIICTHNPHPARLQRVFEALLVQTLTSTHWEVLLIDNASQPPVPADLIARFGPAGRVISEPRLGLSTARARGFTEARGDILVLVDDDNFLAPDYLQACLEIAAQHPQLGVWGGQCLPEFECLPEAWTREFWSYLALRELDRDLWCNWTDITKSPCGAGMCLRKVVVDAYLKSAETSPLRLKMDRHGDALFSGGDTDLAFTACDLGLGMGLFRRLVLHHYMPRQRLAEEYLLKLFEQIQRSCVWLEYLRHTDLAPPAPPTFGQRLLHWYHRFRMTGRPKRFLEAMERGRARGYLDLQQLKQGLIPA